MSPAKINHDKQKALQQHVTLNPRSQDVRETFGSTGSAMATVKAFRKQGLQFPRRVRTGAHKGDLVWSALGHTQVLRILHNPRYAGAFVFGRSHMRKTVDGRCTIVQLPQDEWETLIPGACPGYLSWEDYQQNLKRLHESAQAMGQGRRKSPAREGQKQVERAQYEVDLARRRYMRVDPDNRLVADSLEAEWNGKLRTLTETQQNRERQREQDRKVLSDEQRAAILSLATDFPRLWRDPNTSDRERKRMIRLLLEDVTLVRGEDITLHIRFKGGATKTLTVPAPLNAWQQRVTNPAVVKEIDRLLDHHTYAQIVSILNERGLRSGEGQAFSVQIVARIQQRYGLMPRYDWF